MKIIKNILRVLVILLILFILFNLLGTVYSILAPKIDIKSANSFSIYDKNNNLIYYGSNINNNSWVDIEDMGKYAVIATLSVEDRDFYNHNGFNYLRILKAMYENIKSGEIVQGASTITQQYAKNLFLSFDKTWERKWKEMWLTFNLENNYSKDEIIEGYLNTINYGHGNYGIANASKYYFNKKPSELTLAETSIIVGIPNSPSNYSPISNFNLSKKRQEVVLSRMVENGFITEHEKEESLNEELKFYGKHDTLNLTTLSYYKDAVMKELESIKTIPESYIETNGVKIYTALDLDAQKSLEEGVKDITNLKDIQTSKVMINVKTGGVIALVGGTDYNTSSFNRATESIRQPGSCIKPFLYYTALENGFTASSTFLSEKTTFNFSGKQNYSPSNAGEIYANKNISMATAISYSDNIYAVKTHLFLGDNKLVDTLRKVGITTELDDTPSLPLGTYEVNIIELATSYAILANEGKSVNSHFITKVEDMDGNLLYKYKEKETEQILDSSLSFIISELLTGSYDTSLIDYSYPTCINILNSLTKKYALKSGSTDTDAWVIGYNKDVVLATWAGYDDNKKIGNSVVSHNKKSWATSMEMYLKDKENNWYNIPENVVGVLVDPISGEVATKKSKNKKILYYINGTQPNMNKELDGFVESLLE